MAEANWYRVGPVEALKRMPLRQIAIDGRLSIALSCKDGCLEMATGLIAAGEGRPTIERGGRKAFAE